MLLINNDFVFSSCILEDERETEILMKTNQTNTHNTEADCGSLFIKLVSIQYGSTTTHKTGFCIDSQDKTDSCDIKSVSKTL